MRTKRKKTGKQPNTIKYGFLFIFTSMLILSAAACGTDTGEINFASRADTLAQLTNYLITAEFTDEAGKTTQMTELRCEEGYIWQIGDSIKYIENSGAGYQLYQGNKTGLTLPPGDANIPGTAGTVMSAYLFFHDTCQNFDFEKTGSAKIAGQKTTGYRFRYEDQENQFWVDHEYGITMKYISKTAEPAGTMEITALKVGDAKLSDLVNLSEYDLGTKQQLPEGAAPSPSPPPPAPEIHTGTQ